MVSPEQPMPPAAGQIARFQYLFLTRFPRLRAAAATLPTSNAASAPSSRPRSIAQARASGSQADELNNQWIERYRAESAQH
jgi:LPS sulfotransferase NodH